MKSTNKSDILRRFEREMLNKILHIPEDTKKRGPNFKIRIHL
jgi:hypothetical protein